MINSNSETNSQSLEDFKNEVLEDLGKNIILELFGNFGNIPVKDTLAYNLPDSYWEKIRPPILFYKNDDFPRDLYNSLCKFFGLDFFDMIEPADLFSFEGPKLFHLSNFRSVLSAYLGIRLTSVLDSVLFSFGSSFNMPEKKLKKGLSLMGFVESLYNFYYSYEDEKGGHPFRIPCKKLWRKCQQKKSQFVKKTVREEYIIWDSLLTDRFFKEADFLKYPCLMIDRFQVLVYSENLMTYQKNVKLQINSTKKEFIKDVQAEVRAFDTSNLKVEFGQEDVDAYHDRFKNELDERFDFMNYRSLNKALSLSQAPKITNRSDSGGPLRIDYAVQGGTITFYAYPRAEGGPISLFASFNLQQLVLYRIAKEKPEIMKDYKAQFLKEPNFIPLGWEAEYQKHEKEVLEDIKNQAVSTYCVLVRRLGFSFDLIKFIEDSIKIRVTQAEICWNNILPLNPVEYMENIMNRFESWGLFETKIDDSTPLMVTKFRSDITPDTVLAWKHYVKSKQIMRQELVYGSELTHPCNFHTKGSKYLLGDSSKIHEQFFIDSDRIKKYLYGKAVFHLLRHTEGFSRVASDGFDIEAFSHGFHRFNLYDQLDEEEKLRSLGVSLKKSGLPEAFKDLNLFISFVEKIKQDGYVTRKLFTPKKGIGWTYYQFNENVMNSYYFERIGRGKYKLKCMGSNNCRSCDDDILYFVNFVDEFHVKLKKLE